MIYVKLLGTTVVEVDGVRLPDAALGGRLRQVLEILAVEGRPVAKEMLADHVWDGEPPPTYLGTLESYVCVLRKRLGLSGGRESSLATRDRGYVLAGDDVRVDLDEVRSLLHPREPRRPDEQIRTALQALTLVRGPLVAQEPYAAWALRARQAFDQELTEAVVPIARLANARGDHAAALVLARSAVERLPYCEVAWQELIRAHWLAGDRAEALRGFAVLRQLLLEELGEQPSAASQDLYLTVLRSEECARRATDGQELGLLLRLLRQALEGVPGLAVPDQDAALATTAVHVLGAGLPALAG
jgi:DNA-binding SARP family transcriptional activator